MERKEAVGGRPPKRRPLRSVILLTAMMIGKNGRLYLGIHCAESLATESLLKSYSSQAWTEIWRVSQNPMSIECGARLWAISPNDHIHHVRHSTWKGRQKQPQSQLFGNQKGTASSTTNRERPACSSYTPVIPEINHAILL